jgi:hypothetical protein
MEPTQLQLVLNVVTITGVTSLAGYCYLLKKENRKLATQKEAPKAEVAQAVVHLPSEVKPATIPIKGLDQDIRTFASARRKTWVEVVTPSMSEPD